MLFSVSFSFSNSPPTTETYTLSLHDALPISAACRKSLFDRLLNFLKLQKSFKKSFDPTRKGTLTVPFHTILPSESFSSRVYRQPQPPRLLCKRGGFSLFPVFCSSMPRRSEDPAGERVDVGVGAAGRGVDLDGVCSGGGVDDLAAADVEAHVSGGRGGVVAEEHQVAGLE